MFLVEEVQKRFCPTSEGWKFCTRSEKHKTLDNLEKVKNKSEDIIYQKKTI